MESLSDPNATILQATPYSKVRLGIIVLLLAAVIYNCWNVIVGIVLGAIMFVCGMSVKLYMRALQESTEDVKRREVPILRGVLKDAFNSSRISETGSFKSTESFDVITNDSGETHGSTHVKKPRPKLDMRLSGSALIDETLHEMIDYIMRDYVHSWYDHLSEDDDFIHELRKTLQVTLVNLSSRVKEIDWIPYLTTHLVDDAASHLRLYRTALAKTKENPNLDLVSVFFDVEAAMEKNLCRDMVCTDNTHLEDYLQGICQSLLYLLLPQDTYSCTPIGALAQDLLVHYVFIPLIQLFSDPDYVNQNIIWLCQSFPATPDALITVVRTCDTLDEIAAVQFYFDEQLSDATEKLNKRNPEEVGSLRAQQKGLKFIKNLIDQRVNQLKSGPSTDWTDEGDGEEWQNYYLNLGLKLHCLSVSDVLKNPVALSYFMDFMQQIHGYHYIHMYLNIEAWKSSAEQQLSAIELSMKPGKLPRDVIENNVAMHECMRTAAVNIYDLFLSEKAQPRVKLPEKVVHRFYIQARTEPTINLNLFDEIQEALIEVLENTEKFYPSFMRHKLYVKCLMEIDLLKAESVDTNVSDEDDEGDEVDAVACDEFEEVGANGSPAGAKFTWDYEEPPQNDYQLCRDCLKQKKSKMLSLSPADELILEKSLWLKKYKLNAEIIEAGLTSEKGKQFGVYAVQVTRMDEYDGKEKKWHIYRRYSDFYDFHQWIKSKWGMLNRVEFPSKHTFRSTDRKFLEQRMTALNKYLCSVLTLTVEPCYGESLQDSLLHFLEPGNYVVKKKLFIEKIDTLVNPLKQSVRSVTDVVKSVPDTFINTMDGFTKIFQSKPSSTGFIEAHKVGASIEETDDNIPLRIILLMMDELFDLKSRNQWLRRRLVAVIRQVLKAMFGDTINRRIVDYVAYLTSPVRVTGYLQNLQRSLWPNGQRIHSRPARDADTKMRTKFAAKLSLVASLSDELKHLIGSETTKRGILCVFDMCQNPTLNRRFVLVLFEGILRTLFPDKPFSSTIQRLHFRSNRVGKNRPFLISPSLNMGSNSATPRGSFSSGSKLSTPTASLTTPLISPPSNRKRK